MFKTGDVLPIAICIVSDCIFGLFLILWLGVLIKVKFRMQLYATIVLVSFMIAFSLKAFADTVRVIVKFIL